MRTSLLSACLSVVLVVLVVLVGCGDGKPPRAGSPPKGVDHAQSTLFHEGFVTPYRFELRRSPGELAPGSKVTIDVAVGREAKAPKPSTVKICIGDPAVAAKVDAVAMDAERGEHWRAEVAIPGSTPEPHLVTVQIDGGAGGMSISAPLR